MILGYLCAIGIAVIFMLYMDGNIGVMMLAFLLLMPVLSAILTLVVRRSVRVEMHLKPDSSAKQRDAAAIITLEKNLPIPLPFLRMQLRADGHFSPLNPNAEEFGEKPEEQDYPSGSAYRKAYKQWRRQRDTGLLPNALQLCLTMGTELEKQYKIKLTPQFCGNGAVSLTNFSISDFLGMFHFKMNLTCRANLLIMPEIPELKANTELFRSVSTAVAAADEETDATPNQSASSMPGYDHRNYIPGDSLKRINWKLSSKRKQLMVRQDEPIALARLSVVLDFRRDSRRMTEKQRYAEEELLIETALGFLMLCAKYGYPCTLCYADENAAWSSLAIDDGEQLAVEAVSLLRGGFRPAKAFKGMEPFPPALVQEQGAVLLYFTTNGTPETAAVMERLSSMVYMVVPEAQAGSCAVPENGGLWLVASDRQLVRAEK